ncbi:MAG: tRNA pseudouridine(38-40) synthase TruA [Actinobacteria bacterium]|nr:tRNA pseudouridine(38-40) synthase TruA [Actinomycetota bacterium]
MTLFEGAADKGSAARCKLVVAYDGTDFRGYAGQPAVRTVEGTLSEALAKVLHAPATNLACAGRTDAGVHAWGQVVSFDAAADLDVQRVSNALNGMLAPEIVVRSAELVEPGFDARRSAQWRTYTYAVVNRPVPDPFLTRYAWWVPEPLDLAALRLGADPFVGEHDFASFCRAGPEGSTTVRRVLASRWVAAEDGVLRYEIAATAFCWQMVRSIVGTLVDVGVGKFRPGDLMRIIRSRDRAAAGRLAPPQGLCLWEVGY